jgi:hypothetical protein
MCGVAAFHQRFQIGVDQAGGGKIGIAVAEPHSPATMDLDKHENRLVPIGGAVLLRKIRGDDVCGHVEPIDPGFRSHGRSPHHVLYRRHLLARFVSPANRTPGRWFPEPDITSF